MPSRDIHRLIDLLILGRDFGWLHRAIDAPCVVLGRRHRILFHDERVDPLITFLLTNDLDAAIAHYLHIKLDKMCSRDRRLEKILRLYRLLTGL